MKHVGLHVPQELVGQKLWLLSCPHDELWHIAHLVGGGGEEFLKCLNIASHLAKPAPYIMYTHSYQLNTVLVNKHGWNATYFVDQHQGILCWELSYPIQHPVLRNSCLDTSHYRKIIMILEWVSCHNTQVKTHRVVSQGLNNLWYVEQQHFL